MVTANSAADAGMRTYAALAENLTQQASARILVGRPATIVKESLKPGLKPGTSTTTELNVYIL